MRNLCSLLIVALAIGCGASSGEVATAKSAHYKGDKLAIFNAAKAAVQDKYKIDKSDENTLGFQTLGRWYTPEGNMAAEGNSEQNSSKTGYNSQYPDLSLNLVFAVGLKADGDSWVVQVRPIIERYHAGSPKTEPLTEDDISVPGYVHGKVDALALDIHTALQQYEVKTLPGSVPPPTAAPAPAGSAAAPAPAADPAAAPASGY